MNINKVKAIYFSPVGNTKTTVERIAAQLAAVLQVPLDVIDFTLPAARAAGYAMAADELVVFGMPTYAGRIPNKALPFVQTLFTGEGTPAVAVVTFGNRSFDSALTELRDELDGRGFHVFAAAAFACNHVFSDQIGMKRPDAEDILFMDAFIRQTATKLVRAETAADLLRPVIADDEPVRPYYVPKGMDGQPAKFLKAKPQTDAALCTDCKICANVCPMGAVDWDDPLTVNGICIKCQACVAKCPTHAKYFDDAAFLSHVRYLETHYRRRANSAAYL